MRIAVNRIGLNFEVSGEGPPLLLLHGFTGSLETWAPLRDAWPNYQTVSVDVIGHGGTDSPADPARYRMDAFTADLAALLNHLGIVRCGVLGYSLGGRIALRFALRYPDRVSALVLESGSPGIEDPAERDARIRSDEELADSIDRDGLAAFVDYWENLPMWASQAALPQSQRDELRRARLRCNPAGLANSLRGIGAGVEGTVLDRLAELMMPTLVVAGDLDAKYGALAAAMAARLPDARIEIVAGAGHAVHLEKPREFGQLVLGFLSENIRQVTEAKTL